MARPVGRPSKYSPAMQALAEEYLRTYQEMGDVVPTLVGLALQLDVDMHTIYNWATEANPKFLQVFTRLQNTQHRTLVNGGLGGTFNPAITKMMMTKHGYSDKQELDHTSRDGSMSPTRIELVAKE